MSPCRHLAIVLWVGLLRLAIFGAEPAFERHDAFRAGEDGYHSYRLPTLVCTRSGALVLFADGRKNNAGDIGRIDPVVRRSIDGGRTWQPMQVLFSDPGERTKIGNACALYDRDTDTIHVIFLFNLTRAYLRSSRDGGVSFGPAREITTAFREFNFPWAYFATGHVHGIQLRSGRLVAPVWVNNVPRLNETKGEMRNGILYSDDEGQTWHAGGLAPFFHSLNESSVYEASDGSLVLNSRAMRTGSRAVTRSADQGITWTEPALDQNLPDPTCQASTLTLRDRDGRNCVLFSNPANPKSRSHLTVRLSYDDGRSWPVSKLVDAGGAGYSDLASAPDGTLYLAYERAEKRSSDRITVVRFTLEAVESGIAPP